MNYGTYTKIEQSKNHARIMEPPVQQSGRGRKGRTNGGNTNIHGPACRGYGRDAAPVPFDTDLRVSKMTDHSGGKGKTDFRAGTSTQGTSQVLKVFSLRTPHDWCWLVPPPFPCESKGFDWSSNVKRSNLVQALMLGRATQSEL